MTKQAAIALLGGDIPTAARAIGVTRQAIYQWPERLTPLLRDRVIAARWRLDEALRRAALLDEHRSWAHAQETQQPARTPRVPRAKR